MNGGQERFTALSESGDDEVIDLTRDSDNDMAPNRRRKAKLATDGTAVPKWSNPEYLTALPPPESSSGPKKDIVQVIRKAKNESVSRQVVENAMTNNVDFISFEDHGDDITSSDPSSSASDEGYGLSRRKPLNDHGQPHSGQPAPVPLAARISKADVPSPTPPQGLVIPTDEEVLALSGALKKGQKRKRAEQSGEIEVGDIVPEWQSNGIDPTPWFRGGNNEYEDPGFRYAAVQ
jgi:non-canonical poly(A) RNA polymerase PAPD5/7